MLNGSGRRVIILSEGPKISGPGTWKNALVRELEACGFHPVEIDVNHPASFFKLPVVITSDAVHGYHVGGTSLLYIVLAKVIGKKVLYTVHGDVDHELKTKTGLRKMLWQPMHAAAFASSNTVTFPSRFILEKVTSRRFSLRNKAVVIPNGIDVPDSNVATNHESYGNILAITNFNYPQKAAGLKPLIEAINRLHDEIPAVTLTILGGGRELESYISKYHNGHIRFEGHQKVTDYLRQTSLFVHSTFLDNMPYVILEAMAAHKPVVTVPVGGIPDMVTEESLAEPNPAALYEKIKAVLQDKTLQDLIVAKNNRLIDRLNWKVVIHDFAKNY